MRGTSPQAESRACLVYSAIYCNGCAAHGIPSTKSTPADQPCIITVQSMHATQCVVQDPSACEAMGRVTAVCADMQGDPIQQDLLATAHTPHLSPRGWPAETVAGFRQAGVCLRLVTAGSLQTARRVASECGLLTPQGVALDAATLRQLSPVEAAVLLPHLQVVGSHQVYLHFSALALFMVCGRRWWLAAHRQTLSAWLGTCRSRGTLWQWWGRLGGTWRPCAALTWGWRWRRVVRTNANPKRGGGKGIRLVSHIAGAMAVKDAAGLVMPTNDAACLLRAVVWGRTTLQRVRSFLVFQLTCNLVTLTVSALASLTTGRLPLNVMQLLWINLHVDSLGAVGRPTSSCFLHHVAMLRVHAYLHVGPRSGHPALATEAPSAAAMPPMLQQQRRLVTPAMWLHVAVQVCVACGAVTTKRRVPT